MDTGTDTDAAETSSDEPHPKKKSKKTKHSDQDNSEVQSTHFTFDPTNIMHPRSSDWVPAPVVTAYLHDNLRRGFDKEVRNRLRSECPRPDIPDKVTETPDIDTITFLKKFAKDPKKGIDRAWRSCQDKLLDVVGPLAKILGIALEAQESATTIDPHVLAGGTQRAICLFGNANCAISTERRKSLLVRMDTNLTDLASAEPGPLADRNLVREHFVNGVAKYVGTFTTLYKAQSGIKRVFQTGVFNRARRGRGCSIGCPFAQGPPPR